MSLILVGWIEHHDAKRIRQHGQTKETHLPPPHPPIKGFRIDVGRVRR